MPGGGFFAHSIPFFYALHGSYSPAIFFLTLQAKRCNFSAWNFTALAETPLLE